MRVRSVFVAVSVTAILSCWFAVRAQQQVQTPPDRVFIQPVPLEPDQVTSIANEISKRAERFKPLFQQVNTSDWVAKGAPEVYVSQWASLSRQNEAIMLDMAGVAAQPEAMSDVMKSLFRLHRFDADLQSLLGAVRRYQTGQLADQIESVAAADQRGIEQLQQHVLDLANQKEHLLDIEDKEAQRCRSTLASQPIVRPQTTKKANGITK